jgi:myo-inositol-1(or 4)-monophosphatase
MKDKIIKILNNISDDLFSSGKELHKKDISIKSDGTFVTKADTEIEKYLIKELIEVTPNANFLAEESGGELGNETWILDPIDGTTNFIHALKQYSISLCYTKNTKPLFSFIFLPFSRDYYYAEKGKGAYFFKYIHDEKYCSYKLSASDNNISNSIVIIGFPIDKSKLYKILKFINDFYPVVQDIKRIGSSSLDICKVAEGSCDLYFELDLKKWDYAGAKLILEEAGGMLIQNKDITIATNKNNIQYINNYISEL